MTDLSYTWYSLITNSKMDSEMKTISRKAIQTIAQEAHRAAYRAGSLFGDYHRVQQGRLARKQEGHYTLNGYEDYKLDFVPLSTMYGAAHLKNKGRLKVTTVAGLRAMLRKSFVDGMAWGRNDQQVLTKDFLSPVLEFLEEYESNFEIFAGEYLDRDTHAKAFTVYAKLIGVEENDQLCWEITINDVDLVKPYTASLHNLFKR